MYFWGIVNVSRMYHWCIMMYQKYLWIPRSSAHCCSLASIAFCTRGCACRIPNPVRVRGSWLSWRPSARSDQVSAATRELGFPQTALRESGFPQNALRESGFPQTRESGFPQTARTLFFTWMKEMIHPLADLACVLNELESMLRNFSTNGHGLHPDSWHSE